MGLIGFTLFMFTSQFLQGLEAFFSAASAALAPIVRMPEEAIAPAPTSRARRARRT